MFGVDSSELFVIILVAVVVIGPKDLPRVMRTIGHWVGKARGMASQFRLGVDQMMRETEIADLEKKWREQNEAIMKAHPMAAIESDWGKPSEPTAPDKVMLEKASPPPAAAVMVEGPPPAIPAPVSKPEALSPNPGRRKPRTAPELP